MANLYFFVYGTLQSGFKNHQNVVKGRYTDIKSARLPNAVLYHFTKAGFPGMWRASDDDAGSTVHGQLLQVPLDCYEAVLAELDLLEDYYGPSHPNNMYDRQEVLVQTSDGSTVTAWAYFCCIDKESYGAVRVHHGDWRRFMAEGKLDDAGDDWADVLQRANAAASVAVVPVAGAGAAGVGVAADAQPSDDPSKALEGAAAMPQQS